MRGILIRIGMAILSVLPIERIIAMLLDSWLKKFDGANIEKASKTAKHLAELSALFGDILADHEVTAYELSNARGVISAMRIDLLRIWAKGGNGKFIQNCLPGAEYGRNHLPPRKMEPLLKGMKNEQAGKKDEAQGRKDLAQD